MPKNKTEKRTTEANANNNENKQKNIPLGLNKRGNQKKR